MDNTTDQLAQRIAELPELPPVIRSYRLVACYAEVLLGVCMEADKKEELGNVDGSHLDDLANALGHLADVERDGLDSLIAAQAPLIERIKEMESSLRFERSHVQQLQKALSFWLPMVPESPEAVSKRVADDAMLLIGYEGEDEPSAEALGWMSLASEKKEGGK